MNDVLKKLLSYDAKKRQLFLLMLKQQGVDISELILPQERADGVFPVSFGQQRLWFLDQVEEEKAAYNEAFAITLDGELDVALLKQSFDVLCERHESLRTTFRMENGEVQQVIGEAQTVAFTLHDMRIYPDELRQLEVDHLLHAERQTPFDLAAGPLWRVCLLQVGEQQHVLSLVLHHIICDATSNTVLYEELFTVYAALQSGRAWELPSVDLQYADYAVWQRNWLTGTNYQNQLAYWKKELSGAPSLLELPTDRPRPPVQSFRGSSWTMRLPKRLTADLHALGEREKSTMFTVLLAGFHVLLHRHSGQNDIVVGTPIGGRNRSEIERTIGFFANTQVMRAQIAEGDRFLDLLRLVKEKTLAAHEHQEFPFEKLVEELNPERDLSYSPLFQVMFTYLQVQNSESWRLPKLVAEMKKVDTGFVKFDLTFNLLEGSHGLQLHVEYNADLFAERTIERMAGHFQTLLEAIVAEPSGEVALLPMLTTAERSQLAAWNRTSCAIPDDKCLHQLIEAQVQRTPDAVAVVFGEHELTYRELNERADRLAIVLQQAGVGPGVRTGFCAHRSLDLVTGLLAILKAGGAYVPLDPEYPQDRLAYIVQDSGLQVLLTEQSLCGAWTSGLRTICLDQASMAETNTNGEAVVSGVQPDDLAYVIYTSGSTGQPKGVLVTHRNVVNFCTGMDQQVGAGADETLLAVTSISFDISVLELFWTLTTGAKVVLLPEQPFGGSVVSGSGKAPEMDFSLFYFASDEDCAGDKYELLIEGAKFADQHGFAAVWTPERHFHAFGGLYPSPSVVSGALAVLTERIQLRAGSVVLPLHHPVRVAEEWAVVDNLSRGRVGLSLASGWHADDFVLAPEQYANRHQVLEQSLDTLKRLWRGEEVLMPNGVGHEIAVRTLPRPVQADVPIWITSAGSPQTFEKAGELGANVLTHLLGQSLEELQDKIAIYRAALQKHGHDPKAGQVALMLHTFVGADQATVRETVRQPFLNYLKSSFGLVENMVKSARPDLQLQDLSAEDLDDLMAMSFDRYFETSGLFGTPDSCVDMIARLKAIGVDEVACLIDFGVDQATVRESLVHLNELRGRCVRTEDEAPAALTLAQQAERHRPTMMQCTPSMMRLVLADKEATASLQGVKRFLLGGEALPAQVAAEVHDTFVAQLLNMYGPTETTIWSAVHHVQAEELPIPIGRPIANTQLYILDRHLQELPVGVPGQLYIGGAGVTRGYHNRPELTAERYLSHPIADRGQKLYQTGDVAKRLADGTIVLLGRDDQQVKLNGYRIELGEIEAVLTSHPAVREAVAVVKADDTGGKQLLLYAVLAEGQTLNEEAARRFLKEKLPSYFLPSALVFVDKMPLTPNGKVDRQALLGIKPLKAQAAQYQPPRTPIEETVCAIWADVLEVERVGIADDFFELGGHSLLITKLLMRIRDVFGLELPLRALFQSRTPAALADIIVEQQLVQADDDLLDRLLAELEEV